MSPRSVSAGPASSTRSGPSRPEAHTSDRRPCFLCDSWKGEQLFVESWPIVGLRPVTLGVRVCSGCGMVYQDPVIPWETMSYYYIALSNYTNPGRSGLPSPRKVETVDRQLALLEGHVSRPGSAFQVGCSDGYTLHRLRQRGWSVSGVDPSPSAAAVAVDRWDLDLQVAFFEEWEPPADLSLDLVVLTHVLEHVYDPVAVLRKCGGMLGPGGLVLIETPVVQAPDLWPPGYFTFEHVNFFSVASMTRTLLRAGFEMEVPMEVRLDHDEYPIMCGLGQLQEGQPRPSPPPPDGGESLAACRHYLELERAEWERIDQLLGQQLEGVGRAVIWGAGIHSSQLLIRTRVASCTRIEFFVDRDPQKVGLLLGAYPVKDPEALDFSDPGLGIIISSRDSEEEIRKSILARAPAARVISLYSS